MHEKGEIKTEKRGGENFLCLEDPHYPFFVFFGGPGGI